MGCVVTSSYKKESDSADGVSKPVAAVTNDGERFVVHRGNCMLNLYKIDVKGQERESKKLEMFDLIKEI